MAPDRVVPLSFEVGNTVYLIGGHVGEVVAVLGGGFYDVRWSCEHRCGVDRDAVQRWPGEYLLSATSHVEEQYGYPKVERHASGVGRSALS